MNLLKELVTYLAEHKNEVVTNRGFLAEGWSPTYGESSSVEYVDIIEFDSLLAAIDEFSKRFD